MKNGQAGLEYLIIVGLLLFALAPLSYISKSQTDEYNTFNNAKSAVSKLETAGNMISAQGYPARTQVKFFMPPNVVNISVLENNTLQFQVDIGKGTSDVFAQIKAKCIVWNITGSDDGYYSINVEMDSNGCVFFGDISTAVIPHVYGTIANETTIYRRNSICVKVYAIDNQDDINNVWITLTYSNGTIANLTMTDNGGYCAEELEDSLYGVQIVFNSTGVNYFNITYANDSENNLGYEDFADIEITVLPNDEPEIIETLTNATNIFINDSVCINSTVLDDYDNIASVWVTLTHQNGSVVNITLTDTGAYCAGSADDNVYGAQIKFSSESVNYFNITYAQDSNAYFGVLNHADISLSVIPNDMPFVSGTMVNNTSVYSYDYVCINSTVTDQMNNLAEILAEITYVNGTTTNITMADTGSSCGGTASDSIYGADVILRGVGTHYFKKVCAIDSNSNMNCEDFLDIGVYAAQTFGNLIVNLTYPSSLLTINRFTLFAVNTTATCSGRPDSICGNITGTARYNTTSTMTNISTTPAARPMYSITANPAKCGVLSNGESCQSNWTINATLGGSSYNINILFASNQSQITSNITNNATVKINRIWVPKFFDNFDDGDTAGWIEYPGTDRWDVKHYGGSKRLHADDCDNGYYAQSSSFDLSDSVNAVFKFDWHYKKMECFECIRADVGNGVAWVTGIFEQCCDAFLCLYSCTSSGSQSLNLESYITFTNNMSVRFYSISNSASDDVYADNINVTAYG